MSELAETGFERMGEADEVPDELVRLQKEYPVDVENAVVVIQPPGREVPRTSLS